MTGQDLTHGSTYETIRPEPPVGPEQPVAPEQPGSGKKGKGTLSTMMYASIPVVVFATAVGFVALPIAIGISIAVAVAVGVFQMMRGDTFGNAIGGVIGVAVAGGISAWTGSANDFFLIGIWAALIGAVVTLASLIMRRPLTGVIWNAMHGNDRPWREDRPTLLAHDLATAAVTLLLAGRFIAQQWAYLSDSTSLLAFADIATGTPVTAVAGVAVFWAFRRSTKRLIKNADARNTAQA
ncbi:DUF3159 domain-containing protein [Nocardiopsis sediminis]|uniref:DUF3159 domain-containing protein n=1 Tax=Nocardiopsis sediminis TaxID=1778267 RepID=A0ABV8FX15_9ACTN